MTGCKTRRCFNEPNFCTVRTVDGSTADVKFIQGKKEIATAQGQIKPVEKKVSLNQLILSTQGRTIQEIDFGGSDTAITFGASSSAAGK